MMHCSAIQANSLLHCREGVQCDAGWRVVSAFERGGAVYNEAHYASSSFSFDTLQCRPMQCSRLQFIMRHITPPPPLFPMQGNAVQCNAFCENTAEIHSLFYKAFIFSMHHPDWCSNVFSQTLQSNCALQQLMQHCELKTIIHFSWQETLETRPSHHHHQHMTTPTPPTPAPTPSSPAPILPAPTK